MAANGVIGITAQILESTDLDGQQQPTPDMSLLQRISVSLRNMRQNWKKMVGSKATGLFWIMLANSKIAQTLINTTFRMIATLMDIIVGAYILPILRWIIENLGGLIDTFQNVVEGLWNWMKDTFGPVWDWIKGAAMEAWAAIGEMAGLLGFEGVKENVDSQVEQFYKDKVLSELTQEELEAWAKDPNTGLIKGGPIPPEHWKSLLEDDPDLEGYNPDLEEEEDFEEVSWVYQNGPGAPADGKLTADKVALANARGDLKLVDEQFTESDMDDDSDSFWTSWLDGVEQFGWTDVQSWFDNGTQENEGGLSWEWVLTAMFGDHFGSSKASGQEVVESLIDASIEGTEGSLDTTSRYANENPFPYYEPYMGGTTMHPLPGVGSDSQYWFSAQ
tara:strand:- start:31462 stop:32628 length:1167 start_codon:yes stop_codon:yes gene_type:complete